MIDKPSGVLSVPSRMGKLDKRPVAGLILQEQIGRRLFPVHRLDEEVSGLLLFALTHESHRAANGWFEEHQIRKIYEAISITPPTEYQPHLGKEQLWHSKLMRGKKRAYDADYGKASITRAKLVKYDAHISIWHLEPKTGRSHQLRYEMTKHGFPIDGDVLYGSKRQGPSGGGIGLRAVNLDFSELEDRSSYGLPESIMLETMVPISLDR